MRYVFLFFIPLFFGVMNAQQFIGEYVPCHGNIKLGYAEDAVAPLSEQGYQLMLPRTTTLRGIVVSLDDERLPGKDSSFQFFYKKCNQSGIAVLHVFTGVPVDLYMNETSLTITDSLLSYAFKKHNLPVDRVVFLGVMASGHRVLRYIEWLHSEGKSPYRPRIRAMILCESAIDWVRQWYEGQKQIRDSLSANGYFEGQMVNYLFAENLHATPLTNIQRVIDFSPYSYFDTVQKKRGLFAGIPVRAYTYADLAYWFSAPGKGVIDSNYPDMSGFINEQKLAGNKHAELSVFYETLREKNEEIGRNHKPQVDTWSLVDKADLIGWILKYLP